jgi:hypothetical protein
VKVSLVGHAIGSSCNIPSKGDAGRVVSSACERNTHIGGGNPLFAEEILSYLTERSTIRTTAEIDTGALAAALPASAQSILTARVGRLALRVWVFSLLVSDKLRGVADTGDVANAKRPTSRMLRRLATEIEIVDG